MKKPLTDQQTEFLVAYRTEGRVKPAAARAGCSRELHYNALRTSETYRKAFAMVQQDFVDELEEEMRQRAIYGVKIPKFYRGEVIGYETRYSDTLLMALLEANNPEKFGGIREELREEDRDAGFCVRWDREEVGRPTLPRMTGPMPPAPPRPPRPPVPPIAECGEPVTYAEWAAARGITGTAAYGPENEETLDRWSASENPGSIEWVREEAAADLESDDVDPFWETSPAADSSEQDDGDVDICVRWETEHDPHERGSIPASRPRPFRRASTHPTEGSFQAYGEESGESEAGFCVRWGSRGRMRRSAVEEGAGVSRRTVSAPSGRARSRPVRLAVRLAPSQGVPRILPTETGRQRRQCLCQVRIARGPPPRQRIAAGLSPPL